MSDQLFDPGPPAQGGSHPTRPGDRVLYRGQRPHGQRYSRTENIRVRAVLQAHLEHIVTTWVTPEGERPPTATVRWGRARGSFATDWVALCLREGMRAPGNPRKVQHAKQDPREDAARTTLRQFLEGADKPDWVLVGIEATICDRRGQALPARAYERQGQLRT